MTRHLSAVLPALFLAACSKATTSPPGNGGGGQASTLSTSSASGGTSPGTGGTGVGGTGGAPPASGGSCEEAIDITSQLSGGMPVYVMATTPETDPLSSCTDTPGSKVYFKVTIPKKANYRIRTVFADGLVIRKACESGPDVTCLSSGTDTITLDPGEYWLIADGAWPGASVSVEIEHSLVCHFDVDCIEPELPVCDIMFGHYQCVGCVDDTDCPTGKVCNYPAQTCGSECTTDAECAGKPAGHKCLPSKVCGCAGAGDCPASSPFCSPTGVCFACPSGFVDCDMDVSNGCESHPVEDGLNCGGCGMSCNGGGCGGSGCKPAPTAPFPGVPVNFFVMDSDTIYYADEAADRIASIPIAGGSPTTIVANVSGVTTMAVDATRVFYATANSVAGALKAGGGAVTYASGANLVVTMASDGTNVFWSDFNGDSVRSAPVGGGAAKLVGVTGLVTVIALSATDVWGVNVNGLVRVPKAGGTVQTVYGGDNCQVLWLDAAKAYFATPDAIYAVPQAGGIPVSMIGLPAHAMNHCVTRITGDATHVYAQVPMKTGANGTRVIKVPKVFGEPSTLADGQTIYGSALTAGGNFGVDATSVYWLTPTAVLKTVPK